MRLAVDIDATPEEVFDLYVDAARRAEWNPAARSVTLKSGEIDRAGSRYLVDTRYGHLIVDVVHVNRPHSYTLHERSRWMESYAAIRFEPLPSGGCRLVADLEFRQSGWLGRLLAPLSALGGRWWGSRELRRLKAVAERDRA